MASRVGGLLSALGLFAFLPLTVVLAPFALVGTWLRRRDAWFSPFLVYAITLFAASGLLFAVHVPHGTFIHSAVALLPHTFVLVLVGVRGVVEWVARRRPWDVERATRIFAAGTVAVAVVGAVVYSSATFGQWQRCARHAAAARRSGRYRAAPRQMSSCPPIRARYSYLSGRPGVVTPYDDLATIEQAMRAYDVRWLVLERDQIVPALEPVLTGRAQARLAVTAGRA